MWLSNLFDKEKRHERRKKYIEEIAMDIFDVSVYNNQLWLCYRGELVAPISMLTKEDGVTVVSALRNLYIERNL